MVDNRGNIEVSLCEEIMVKNYTEIKTEDFRLKTPAVIKKIKIKTCLNIIQLNWRRTMVEKKKKETLKTTKGKSIYNWMTARCTENFSSETVLARKKEQDFQNELIIYNSVVNFCLWGKLITF